MAIRDAVQALGIEVRAGLHTGECEIRGDDIGGIAVHIGARVSALAGPNDVLVSRACPANGISSPSPLRIEGVSAQLISPVVQTLMPPVKPKLRRTLSECAKDTLVSGGCRSPG